MARKITVTGTTPAAVAYDSLTAKGQALMLQIGTWTGSFFDGGIAEGSGAWGEVLAGELDLVALGVKNVKGVAGVLNGTAKVGLWDVTPAESGDDSDFWYLTALGAEVALHAAALAAPAKPAAKAEVKVVEEVGATIQGLTTVALTRTCKNGADHEFRVTKSGSYCYTCDRVAAEAQKAARAAAKA